MNVDTLLEAAKFIELQEEKEKLRQNQTNEISQQSRPVVHHHLQNHVQPPTTTPVIRARQDLPTTTVTVSSGQTAQPTRILNNSFDIINPLVIDEGGEQKRKQPPLVFRSGTREVHNKLEKHRRAHLKECFDFLKKQLPRTQDERKSSNLSILHSALRYIHILKKKERELEHEMEQLARDKISHQQKLAILRKDVAVSCDGVDFCSLVPEVSSSSSSSSVSHQSDHHENLPVEINKNGLDHSNRMEHKSSPKQPPPTVQRPMLPTHVNGVKEGTQQQVQTTALSVLPVGYPVGQGLVLQKVALVPKGLTDLSPLVSNPTLAHFITAPQQLGGKVVPIVNAQYVVKPVVVVSTPSRPS